MLWTALLVGILCGIIGILIDIDHPISHLNGWSGRFLHTPLLTVSGVVLCGLIAYFGGLFAGVVLE